MQYFFSFNFPLSEFLFFFFYPSPAPPPPDKFSNGPSLRTKSFPTAPFPTPPKKQGPFYFVFRTKLNSGMTLSAKQLLSLSKEG